MSSYSWLCPDDTVKPIFFMKFYSRVELSIVVVMTITNDIVIMYFLS